MKEEAQFERSAVGIGTVGRRSLGLILRLAESRFYFRQTDRAIEPREQQTPLYCIKINCERMEILLHLSTKKRKLST